MALAPTTASLIMHSFTRTVGGQSVDFRKQKESVDRAIQVFKAQLIGLWMVVEAMEKQVRQQQEKHTRD